MKTLFSFTWALLCSLTLLAQSPAPEIFVHRTPNTVERVMIQSNDNLEVTQISYQGATDKIFVKLKILKNDIESGKLITQRPDNQQKLTFTNTWMMGGSMYLPNDAIKEFSREIICKAPTGEVITTSGGPIFFPFFYAPTANGKFSPIEVPQAQINEGAKTLSSGESYYEITIPNKVGKYKLVMMDYKDDAFTTRLKLIAPDGRETLFEGK